MKLKKIASIMNSKYPTKSAEAWDNVGLLIGNKNQEVKKVVIALDLTSEVFEKALDEGAELIITHHPFLFKEDEDGTFKTELKEYPYKKSIHNRLLNTGICVYAAHTNYDRAAKGMSLAFSNKFDSKFDKISGVSFGLGTNVRTTYNKFEKKLLKKTGLEIGFTNTKDKEVKLSKIAFLPGTGSPSEMLAAKAEGYDLIITADVKWSTWVLAKEHNIKIAQVSHQMEEVFVEDLKQRLEVECGGVEFIPYIFDKLI